MIDVRVAVLIVAYKGSEFLPDCLSSIAAADSTDICVETFVLDNASPDDSGEVVRNLFPDVHVIPSEINLGFAEGNNYLWRHVESVRSWDYIYLLNQDTIVDSSFLTEAIECMNRHPECGAVQSLLMLHPETDRINTSGNRLHYLGFGLPTRYREMAVGVLNDEIIDYPSGAAVLLRASFIRENGLFDGTLFMYLEDAELGWRCHLLGYPPWLCFSSIVFHKYSFTSTMRSYQYLERNRWWLLATHYRLATLIVLSPAITVMEFGQIVYAIQNGLLAGKWNSLKGFFAPGFFLPMLQSRRRIQSTRKVGDREIVRRWSGEIKSPHLSGWIVRWIANPILTLWHCVACFVVRW
ncbi:Poly-beta-1,6-N-acetyl-D-glucosamine synthase [Neorhodopirellula pilleata]|uniref:Poly-beta-1,6-N-acetyl-D-glucosamine synthase n=2 Tax=Neorhodopirellula pilleata TaxID=2714738 RepID=A0A5C5ZG46_9BACT|nr:Poly-beta-1,6-N-acetyl-D-glucosamine synthase [Neorhodopirellula pilleata]